MIVILGKIREQVGHDQKLALVLDNATFHKTKKVLEFASRKDIDIKLIFNVVARPDLATIGIENVWAACK